MAADIAEIVARRRRRTQLLNYAADLTHAGLPATEVIDLMLALADAQTVDRRSLDEFQNEIAGLQGEIDRLKLDFAVRLLEFKNAMLLTIGGAAIAVITVFGVLLQFK